MADQSEDQQREMVFCHQCQNEWPRAEHGLVEQENDPRVDDDPFPENTIPPLHHHLQTHNPWESDFDESDGSEGTQRFVRLPGGGMQYTFTSIRSNPPSRAARASSPRPPVMDDFQRMIMEMTGPSGMGAMAGMGRRPPMSPLRPRSASPAGTGGARSPHTPHNHGSPDYMGGFNEQDPYAARPGGPRFAANTTERLYPRDANNPQPHAQPVDDLPGYSIPLRFSFNVRTQPDLTVRSPDRLLQVLMQNLSGMPGPGAQQPRDGHAGGAPVNNPFAALFTTILNPAAASHGDAVYTQEALDRVISQLMEQNPSSNAPGPASDAAIASLPKKQVDKSMLGDDGKAECSVCMDDVKLGEEVISLPCGHWFHELCSTMWLKEHDTCPICRTGIMPKQGDGNRPRDPRQPPLNPEPWSRNGPGGAQMPMPGGFTQPMSPPIYSDPGRAYTPYSPPPPPQPQGSSRHGTPSDARGPSRSEDRRSSRGSGESTGSGIGNRMRGWFGGSGNN
ncbi:MAG: kinetochore-associated Ndc80 complex subunit spc24 [Chaenotheca gracillima]|nr:MAG: kinetochore-associated Ndc80 complex subunit spc24 [Chaenotheca gracillima]